MNNWVFASVVVAGVALGFVLYLLWKRKDEKHHSEIKNQIGPKRSYRVKFYLPQIDRRSDTISVEVIVDVMAYDEEDAEETARLNFYGHSPGYALELLEVTMRESNE